MGGQTRKKRRFDHFKRFRVEIAREIVRNGLNTLSLTDDIQHNLHIRELLDQYAIRLLIEWLSTRFGFNIYTKHVKSGIKGEPVKDGNVFENLLLYPFLDTKAELIDEPFRQLADRLLTDTFAPSTELIGGLHEHICNRPLVGEGNHLLEIAPDIQMEDKRRPVGQFYTPPNIVRYCFDRYIESDSNKFMSALKVLSKPASDFEQERSYPAGPAPIKILDPSCGAGNFLIGAIKFAGELGCSETGLISLVSRCLFGMDLDGKAVSLARIAVMLELCHQSPTVREDRAMQERVLAFLRKHIVTSDSVLVGANLDYSSQVESSGELELVSRHALLTARRTLNAATRGLNAAIQIPNAATDCLNAASQTPNPETHCLNAASQNPTRTTPGLKAQTQAPTEFLNFDLVITNPPYVSYGSRNQPEILETQRRLLKSWYPEGAEYKIRLHSIFQDIALRFCKAQGQAILLVPDGFLTGSFYGRLRQLLLNKSTVMSLSELPEDTIGGAVVGRWCVAQYRRKVESTAGEGEDYVVRLQSNCQDVPITYSPLISSIVSPDKSRFRLIFSQVDEQILSSIKQFRSLGTVLRGHTGLRALKGQRQIVSPQKHIDPSWKRGIKSGAQVVAYAIDWDGTWLCVDPALLYKGGFDQGVISNPKIFVRQTGDRLIASVDLQGLYHLNNVHSFSTNKVVRSEPCIFRDWLEHDEVYFYCALMNSTLWLYLYQMNTREQSRALVQVDIETVEALPLPPMSGGKLRNISQLSRLLHEEKTHARKVRFAHGKPHEEQISVEPRRVLDRLVYDLYQLTERQIGHVESCRPKLTEPGANLPTTDQVIRFVDGLADSLSEESYGLV